MYPPRDIHNTLVIFNTFSLVGIRSIADSISGTQRHCALQALENIAIEETQSKNRAAASLWFHSARYDSVIKYIFFLFI